jgi:hypothetical protein
MNGKLLAAETCDPTIPTDSTWRAPCPFRDLWQSIILRGTSTSLGGGSTRSECFYS